MLSNLQEGAEGERVVAVWPEREVRKLRSHFVRRKSDYAGCENSAHGL